MAQIKIFGVKTPLQKIRHDLSVSIDKIVQKTLKIPSGKKAHRFFELEEHNFYMPEGRTEEYLIIEIQLIKGRSKETRKKLIRNLFEKIHQEFNISLTDIEIVIFESEPENWAFRGMHGDEIKLDYSIDV